MAEQPPVNQGAPQTPAQIPPTPQNTPLQDVPLSRVAADAPLAQMLRDKLGTLVGKPSGLMGELTIEESRRIRALRKLHDQRTQLHTQYMAEKLALDQKYQALYDPLYEKRAQIVKGDVEPEEADCVPAEVPPKDEHSTDKGIPKFWLQALQNHEGLQEMIKEYDEPALEALTNIVVLPVMDEPESFKLEFHFAPNPYFTNTCLTKVFHIEEKGDTVSGCDGTEIDWKEGKDLTKKVTKKKKGKKVKTVVTPQESFFQFFADPDSVIANQEPEDEETAEELMNELQEKFEFFLYCGRFIANQLVPNALAWYTGDALRDSLDGEEDEDDGDDDDEDEEEEEEEEEEEDEPPRRGKGPAKKGKGKKKDDDEEEEDEKPPKKKADEPFVPSKPAAPGAPAELPPNCKQQ